MSVLIGDTVEIIVEFRTHDGVLVDPENITFSAYDDGRRQLGDIVPIDLSNRITPGVYRYDYVIPDTTSSITYELKGYVNDNPIIGRAKLYPVYVRE